MIVVPIGVLKFEWNSMWQIHGSLCIVKAGIKEMLIEFFKSDGDKLYEIRIPNRYF